MHHKLFTEYKNKHFLYMYRQKYIICIPSMYFGYITKQQKVPMCMQFITQQ